MSTDQAQSPAPRGYLPAPPGGARRAIGWSFATRAAVQVVQYGFSVALARMLAPGDFGIAGMIGAVTGFAAVLVELGLGPAIVQRRDLTPEQLDGAFALSLTVGTGLTAAFWIGAPLLARFYGAPEIEPFARVAAFGFVASAVGIVPRAVLTRTLAQARLGTTDVLATLGANAVAIGMAISGGGTWSVIVSGVVQLGLMSVLPLVLGPWRPGLRWNLSPIRPLLSVSAFLLAFNLLNYWARTIDNLLIGVLFGERELGVYMRAYSLMLLPITQLTGVLAGTMVPLMSEILHEPSRLREAYLSMLSRIAFLAFPAMLGLSAAAGPFVMTVYGEAWRDMAAVLRVLAVVGALQAISNPTGWLFLSTGRTDRMFRMGIFTSAALVGALSIGAAMGSIRTVAAAYLVGNAVVFVPVLAYSGRHLGMGLKDVWRAIAAPAAIAATMSLAVVGLGFLIETKMAPAGALALEFALGFVLYAAGVRLLRIPMAMEIAGGARRLLGFRTAQPGSGKGDRQ